MKELREEVDEKTKQLLEMSKELRQLSDDRSENWRNIDPRGGGETIKCISDSQVAKVFELVKLLWVLSADRIGCFKIPKRRDYLFFRWK